MNNVKKFLKKIPFVKNQIRKFKGPTLKEYLELMPSVSNKNPIIIDVGANQGQTIDFMLSLFSAPQIYSFEPTISLFKELMLKYKDLENVHIFDLALSESNGCIEFQTSGFSPTNSILHPDLDLYRKYDDQLKLCETFKNTSKSINVATQTFNSWYHENINGIFIDVFKSDTQGFDYNVLKGAKDALKNIGCIIVELQFMNFYQNSVPYYKICELLYDHEFILYAFTNMNRYKRTHQILESDAIFVNKKHI